MSLHAWPALQDFVIPDALTLEYQQGIWGKAHAARTDYRWLAMSAGADFKDRGLEQALKLGDEQVPHHGRSFYWRCLDGEYYAVMAYPSQAEDATGRSDFLEKHILHLNAPLNIPAALAAVLLFAEIQQYDDSLWWDRRREIQQDMDAEGYLTLSAGEKKTFDKESIKQLFKQGLTDLKAYFGDGKALRQLYATLNSPCAFHPDSTHPLSYLALAAFLLPLPREQADNMSIAGWYPSTVIRDTVAEQWDVVILPVGLSAKLNLATSRDKNTIELAQKYTTAVYKDAPLSLNSEEEIKFPSLPKPYCEYAWIKELRHFAMQIDRRWLEAKNWSFQKTQRPPFTIENDQIIGKKLLLWINSVELLRNESRYQQSKLEADYKGQLEVKITVLKIAVFILYPSQYLKKALNIIIPVKNNTLDIDSFTINGELVTEKLNGLSAKSFIEKLIGYKEFYSMIKEQKLYDAPKPTMSQQGADEQ